MDLRNCCVRGCRDHCQLEASCFDECIPLLRTFLGDWEHRYFLDSVLCSEPAAHYSPARRVICQSDSQPHNLVLDGLLRLGNLCYRYASLPSQGDGKD